MLLKIDVTELPIFDPNIRAIAVYRKIIERDRGSIGDADGRKKKQAIKELAFVHLYTHFLLNNDEPNTYFAKYDDPERFERLRNDLDLGEKWTIDEDLQLAIDHYKENVVQTLDLDFMDSLEHSMRETKNYFKGVDYSLRDVKGNFLYKPKEVMQAMKEVDGFLDKIEAARERLKIKQKASKSTIRGGKAVGTRERPRDQRK
jgi:hypothetical protein